MRTRIALAATFGVAFIIVSAQAPAALADGTPSKADRAVPASSHNAGVGELGQPAPTPASPGDADAVLARAATLLSPAPPTPASPAPTVAPPPPPPAPVDTVTPYQRAAWERVALCEEGGDWQVNGPRFSGGLGITRSNWIAYGGTAFASEAAAATEDEQIMVAERIQSVPPDQHGCRGW
ncbi:MAG: transglycosylase family protein [Acidimicrobiales bacterium]|nr:transglycosylase family protein [Acidimicrobiales bacterium]